MPLSEHEQRILDEIERRLAAEDPKFARSTAVKAPRNVARKRLRRAITGFSIGFIVLMIGLVASSGDGNRLLIFGLAAFAIMLASVLGFVRSLRELGPPTRGAKRQTWLERMEERWRKRIDDGDQS